MSIVGVSINFQQMANTGLTLWVSSHYKDMKFSRKHHRAELGKKEGKERSTGYRNEDKN